MCNVFRFIDDLFSALMMLEHLKVTLGIYTHKNEKCVERKVILLSQMFRSRHQEKEY